MFRTILIPLDRSTLAEEAIGPAAAIARAANATLDLVLVHEPPTFTGGRDAPVLPSYIEEDDRYLASTAAELYRGAGVAAMHAVVEGRPAEAICARANAANADLIVMTSHGRTGFNRVWLGSVADAVVRHATVPVLMLRPSAHTDTGAAIPQAITRILVPIDASPESQEIQESATELARCTGARLVLLHVVTPVPVLLSEVTVPLVYPPTVVDDAATALQVEEAHEMMASVAKAWRRAGATVETAVLLSGHTAGAIIDYARGHRIDALAMSTHGRGASRMLVGSVADKIRRACDMPVMLYRPTSVTVAQALHAVDSILEKVPPAMAL
jgi:nucleotide-binding universal stress UspA family protein